MDRPSSLAARPRQTRVARASHGKRMYLRLALLALFLAFAHVWESITLAELRTRVDHERAHQDQIASRLRQLGSQMAQWTGRAEATAGGSTRLGFAVPKDGQVVLLSAGLVTPLEHRRLASARGGHSMWDWIAGSAVAEPRGAQSADFAAASEDEALP